MPERPGAHLDYDDRCAIEEGIAARSSASLIARRLDVSPSTITREVRANRWSRESKSKRVRSSRKCANFDDCRHKRDICKSCAQTGCRKACKLCGIVACCEQCPDFAPRECGRLLRWPYVCACEGAERAKCALPKWRYDARRAQDAADARKIECREGISITEEELRALLEAVLPLLKKGLSPEAIWMANGDAFPVGVRTFYSWMERGVVDVPAILLPRKVRCRPRKKKRARAIARPGREYSDFLALPLSEQALVVEADSVIGYAANAARILSVHFVRLAFQAYLRLPGPGSAPVVEALDALERAMGSPEAFSAAMGTILLDRGEEFSDFEGMERSCLVDGATRCRVFYCDPLSPGQKGSCERNHAELRRILPKGRSDFDLLSERDLAAVASHINSYPRKSLGGKRPIDAAKAMLPEGFVDLLGITEVPLEEVVLRPSLMRHAVKQ